jgi:hypothetical protein
LRFSQQNLLGSADEYLLLFGVTALKSAAA